MKIFNFAYLFSLIISSTLSLLTTTSDLCAKRTEPGKSIGETTSNKKLVWSDEFNVDGPIDGNFWNFEEGFARNHEDQWYQDQNAYCKDGLLVIECKQETRPNPLYKEGSEEWRESRKNIEYTSSSVNTRGKKDFKYGTLEVRARIPVGPGAWPAIWTLGIDKEWPSNGEIDIMEYYRIDGIPHILANAAWGTDQRFNAKWNTQTVPFSKFLQEDPAWASKFHIWRMDWDENSLNIYLDDLLINHTDLKDTVNPDGFNPMQQPHYILLNLALGGDHGGLIDPTAMPLRYEIDYVRLYQ